MTETRRILGLVSLITVALFGLAFITWSNVRPVSASTIQGSEYRATTTASTLSGTFVSPFLVKQGQGSLGSVVITGANTGVVQILDATTTRADQRAPSQATSTIVLAEFPASAAANTYTFDVTFTRGLLVTVLSGLTPTSTITYR